MFRKKIEVTGNTIDIAKTIVNRCLRLGYKINPVKLERMMVIAYGEYYIKTGKRLFDSKISVTNEGVCIRDIYLNFGDYDVFRAPFDNDKIFLASQESLFRILIDIYGDKNVLEIDDDPRLRKLKEIKKVKGNISDKAILEVFSNVERRALYTPILCSASEKAKWFVNECIKEGYEINTFKLEKLLVLAYGEYLVKTGKKLFNENIVIWEAGPMIKEVDEDFRCYAIGFHSPFYSYYLKLDAEERLIRDIMYKYGNMDGFELNANVKLKELVLLKNKDKFVTDEDIQKVFEKHMYI